MKDIQEYNDLVRIWNEKYGHICEGMPISEKDIDNTLLKRVKTTLLSKEFTERQKVKHTMTVIGDFSKVGSSQECQRDGLTRGEHAYMIVQSGKSVLDRC